MRKHSKEGAGLSTPSWETLEAFARGKIEEFVQVLLEDEVTALLGRAKSARRAAVDAPGGYRNGSGKPRPIDRTSGAPVEWVGTKGARAQRNIIAAWCQSGANAG